MSAKRVRRQPQRTCIVCREVDAKRNLVRVVRTPEGLKFQSRQVVYDSEMIPNSIIYPI